jgi:hypothetical protein
MEKVVKIMSLMGSAAALYLAAMSIFKKKNGSANLTIKS